MKEPCEEIFTGTELQSYLTPRPLPIIGILGCPAVHNVIIDITRKLVATDIHEQMLIYSISGEGESIIKKKDRRPYTDSRIEGILKRGWAQKHQEQIFGAVCVIFDWDGCKATDRFGLETAVTATVQHARNLLKDRPTKLILVLQTTLPPLDLAKGMYTTIDEATSVLRKKCELEGSKSVFVLHLGDVEGCTTRMARLARENAIAAYKDEIRRIKKLKNEIPKSHQGLFARHRFKIAYFYDILHDSLGSLKYYQQCYVALRQINPSPETFSLLEIKACCSIVMSRICLAQLSPGGSGDVLGLRKAFEEHLNWYRTHSMHRSTFARTQPTFAALVASSEGSLQGGGPASPADFSQPPNLITGARYSPKGASSRVVDVDKFADAASPMSPTHGLNGVVGSLGLWMHYRSVAQQLERFTMLLDDYYRKTNPSGADGLFIAASLVHTANGYKQWRTFHLNERKAHSSIMLRCEDVAKKVADVSFVPATYLGQEYDPMLVEPKDPQWRNISRDEAYWLSLFGMDPKPTTLRIISLLDNAVSRYTLMRLERTIFTLKIDIAAQYLECGTVKMAKDMLGALQSTCPLDTWRGFEIQMDVLLMQCYAKQNQPVEYLERSLSYISNKYESEGAKLAHAKALFEHLEKPCDTPSPTMPTITSPITLTLPCDGPFLTIEAAFDSPATYLHEATRLRLILSTLCPRPIAISHIHVTFQQTDVNGGGVSATQPQDVMWPHPEFVRIRDNAVVDLNCVFTTLGVVTIDTLTLTLVDNLKLSFPVGQTKDVAALKSRLEKTEYSAKANVLKQATISPAIRVLMPPAKANVTLHHRTIILQKESCEITVNVQSSGDDIVEGVLQLCCRTDMDVSGQAVTKEDGGMCTIIVAPQRAHDLGVQYTFNVSFSVAGVFCLPLILSYNTPTVKGMKVAAELKLQVVCPFVVTYTICETADWQCGAARCALPLTHRTSKWIQRVSCDPSASAPATYASMATARVNADANFPALDKFPAATPLLYTIQIKNTCTFDIDVLSFEMKPSDVVDVKHVLESPYPVTLSEDEEITTATTLEVRTAKDTSLGSVSIKARRKEDPDANPSVFFLPMPTLTYFLPHLTFIMHHGAEAVQHSPFHYTLEVKNRAKLPLRILVALTEGTTSFHVNGRLEWHTIVLPGASQKFTAVLHPLECGMVTLPQFVVKPEDSGILIGAADVWNVVTVVPPSKSHVSTSQPES